MDVLPTTHICVAAKVIQRRAEREGRDPKLERLRVFDENRVETLRRIQCESTPNIAPARAKSIRHHLGRRSASGPHADSHRDSRSSEISAHDPAKHASSSESLDCESSTITEL
ncbi:hypothetical protein, partial [Bradyrhizobium elkanii]|uniref:hypothetical protein n=1 Tax=Bradyrhizobium elkanii TaxID=29448 RepID=UPI001FCE82A1